MTPERYAGIYRWFTARPGARAALRRANRLLPLATAACYGVLLAVLGVRAAHAAAYPDAAAALVRAVLVPALALAGGSLLRRWINAPRPYDRPGFVPLLEKETQGRACPSRHALSAGVIAAVWWPVSPAAGALALALALCVCAVRVLAGVHSVRDVAFGVLLGFACGVLGTWL